MRGKSVQQWPRRSELSNRRGVSDLRRLPGEVQWVWPAVILMGALVLPGAASGAPVTEYALRRPKHEQCRSHYPRWPERGHHRSSVRCIYQPSPYCGPWNSAHEPSLISNAEVSPASGGPVALEVTASRQVWCVRGHPEPITWTLSDPSGWSSLHLEQYGGGCTLPPPWQEPPEEMGGKPDFALLPSAFAATVILEWPDLVMEREIPVFHEVSGRHGVIAQGALFYVVSGNGLGGHFRHGGWPTA